MSPECVAAAENVDLVVVEGMGRAIETNLYASFSCDSLKLAMVKHPEVRFALSPTAIWAPQPRPADPPNPCPASSPHLLGITRPPSLDSTWVKLRLCQHSTTCTLYHISNDVFSCCPEALLIWSRKCILNAAIDVLQLVALYESTVLHCRCCLPHRATAITSC